MSSWPRRSGTEHHAVGQPQPIAGQHGELALARRSGLIDDDMRRCDVAAARMIAVGELGEVVLAQLRDRETDHAGLPDRRPRAERLGR